MQIPVYLYEYAATRPERANLENIRRGQYEGLKSEIGTNPDRQPDYGPARLGKAGATVIGARNPLIAFNVYLTTPDVEIAKKIAKAIRQSSGGLRYVKALGLLVEGRAQVSMNLTNFRETPIGRVVEMIRREAARYGVAIHHSELIGLIPQQALVDAAVWYTQLDGFSTEQILESRLYETTGSSGPSKASRAACFLHRAGCRRHCRARRWICRRAYGRPGRCPGRNGLRFDLGKKEICGRRSRHAGHTVAGLETAPAIDPGGR